MADTLVCAIDVLFLLRSALAADWGWLRLLWVRLALLFWVWLLACSLPDIGIGGLPGFGQAGAFVRFLLLPAALGCWVLRDASARIWMQRVLTVTALYIALQTVVQLTFGRNIQGFPRNGDGALTGPFEHPRAGTPLSRLIFPVLLPPAARLLAQGRFIPRAGAACLMVASVAIMVLIGQRMPLLLTAFGLILSGLLLPKFRVPVVGALAAGIVLLAASAAISPPAFYRLVTKFSTQMENFPDSNYGQIAGRAVVITLDHPLMGRGFDGFRNACADPATFRGLTWAGQHEADGGGLAGCNIHPHNHYLEAMTEAGLPGLALFSALVVAWLSAAGRGLLRDPSPLRVGLFVSLLIHEWPIASAGGFTSIELSGFFFLLLGYALAEAPERPAWPRRLHDVPDRPRSDAASHGEHFAEIA